MTITVSANVVERHVLSFDNDAVEVTIDDNGMVEVIVRGTSPMAFSDEVWDDVVKFVNAARVMSE